METGLILLGCACAALAVHPFLTYPLSLALLARVRPRPLAPIEEGLVPSKPHSPATGDGGESGGGGSVALCVCAYNEAGVIRAKAENMLAMRAAIRGSTSWSTWTARPMRTAEILEEYADRITVVAPRSGRARRTG